MSSTEVLPPAESKTVSQTSNTYSTIEEAKKIFDTLLHDPTIPLPQELQAFSPNVKIFGNETQPTIPTPFKETEAISALKALEATLAIALGKLRFGLDQTGSVDVSHATIFLFMNYLSRIDGFGKWDPESVERLKPTDLFEAQSNIYRRLSSNIYKTKDPSVYYHTHGSLDSTPVLQMIGLPGYNPSLKRYDEICNVIQEHCSKYSAEELDAETEKLRQAGGICFKREDFLKTEQGQAVSKEPLISLTQLEDSNPPAPFPPLPQTSGSAKPQILAGIKVLDLSRVIAGPVISRVLAEYGANILKVTSASLPDVPYFQLDLNFGKRTTELNLKDPEDRKTFESLLDDVDVIIDGYRTGALERLGYGYESLTKRFANRGKGFVYVAENCFGFTGPWKNRSGWQPIADAVSGVAWGHGQALGLNEPVLPPFPIADFATGELGAIAAMNALYHRATKGGSYLTTVSLTKYNLWVMSLGQYPKDLWDPLFEAHASVPQTMKRNPGEPEISMRSLYHLSNFDIVSKAAMQSMRYLHPGLFDERYMFEVESDGFGRNGKPGIVKSCKPVVSLSGTTNGFVRVTRPNGYDKPAWDE